MCGAARQGCGPGGSADRGAARERHEGSVDAVAALAGGSAARASGGGSSATPGGSGGGCGLRGVAGSLTLQVSERGSGVGVAVDVSGDAILRGRGERRRACQKFRVSDWNQSRWAAFPEQGKQPNEESDTQGITRRAP